MPRINKHVTMHLTRLMPTIKNKNPATGAVLTCANHFLHLVSPEGFSRVVTHDPGSNPPNQSRGCIDWNNSLAQSLISFISAGASSVEDEELWMVMQHSVLDEFSTFPTIFPFQFIQFSSCILGIFMAIRGVSKALIHLFSSNKALLWNKHFIKVVVQGF